VFPSFFFNSNCCLRLSGNNDNVPTSSVELLTTARCLFEQLVEETLSWEEVNSNKVWEAIRVRVEATKKFFVERSRTSALWLQYMEMVDILKTFITAERIGNWELHLQTLNDMLPFLAAAGHNLYVKCVRLYLQSMGTLERDKPEVYRDFMSGMHVVRRSDRYCAGLSTDLMIEQVLMRNLKTSGGLTRGRGMTEQQRVTWLLSMPASAEINRTMQEFTGVNYNSGEQNKDMTDARKERDKTDTSKILSALADHSPFSSDPHLRNIMNGVHGDSSVNVDDAKTVGEKVLSSMTCESPLEYTFKKANHAVTLATKSAIKIDNEHVQVYPQLLFQRLILASHQCEDLPALFCYELCTYPASLFDSSLMLLQPNKPALADALWSKLSPQTQAEMAPNKKGIQYVLDGGALLHRIVWPSPGTATYKEVCELYCSYVTKKYGRAIIVFDGYKDSTSTKQMTQQRRASGKTAPTVSVSGEIKTTVKKDLFLSNAKNKQQFIDILSSCLSEHFFETLHASSDADVLIVKTAVGSTETNDTVLVADDTDLLVLLLYHADPDCHDLFFVPEPKSNAKKRRVWNIKSAKLQLGNDICQNILFIHAILGCDTTSRVYGIGKGASLKKFITSSEFRDNAKLFQDDNATKESIQAAGENALLVLLSGKPGQRLDDLRYQRYQEKLATKRTKIKPNNLPPTSAAAKYHSFRVFYQIQQWKGEELDAQQWGWKLQDSQLVPVMTDLPPATESLLKVLRCNCKRGCDTLRCTCRKHGLSCSAVCGNCKGSGCSNSSDDSNNDDDDE